MLEFNFGNAFMHFARTGAPRGFTWKYLLSYVLVAATLMLGFFWLMSDFYISLFANIDDPLAAEQALQGQFGQIVLAYLLMIPIGGLFWAMFEAAFQRRYMRGDTFKLRIGGDELRLLVVGLLWMVLIILMYILFAVITIGFGARLAITSSSSASIGFVAIGIGCLFAAFWIFVSVRLAAASALTVRDGKIRFASSWGVTSGRFWPMLGAYLVMLVASVVIYLLLIFVFGIVMGVALATDPAFAEASQLGVEPDPDIMAALFTKPGVLVSLALGYLPVILFQAWFGYVWAGPAALAARTDPNNSSGVDSPAEAFS